MIGNVLYSLVNEIWWNTSAGIAHGHLDADKTSLVTRRKTVKSSL